ncbi:MAG: helix-turn-helix domain-containing protein [Candidatus Thorarchaeota archaeon]|nr:helix-turn-helix domain-containing protein [Candidatus Thorarchaeota archaeon]
MADNDNILIVKDSDSEELLLAVTRQSHTVISCRLSEALSFLADHKVKVLLLDCGIDVQKGLTLLEEIKQRWPSVPVVFITGKSTEETIIEAFRAGAIDFLRKPVDIVYLRDLVVGLLKMLNTPRGKRVRQRYALSRISDMLSNATTGMPAGIIKAINYMEEHFSEDISLEKLASEACMSKFHFSRIFTSTVGASPMKCLIRIRVERAMELLKHDRSSISMVSSSVGFNDLSSFIKNFKKIAGTTPSSYRKTSLI